jgi:hypothetical protein
MTTVIVMAMIVTTVVPNDFQDYYHQFDILRTIHVWHPPRWFLLPRVCPLVNSIIPCWVPSPVGLIYTMVSVTVRPPTLPHEESQDWRRCRMTTTRMTFDTSCLPFRDAVLPSEAVLVVAVPDAGDTAAVGVGVVVLVKMADDSDADQTPWPNRSIVAVVILLRHLLLVLLDAHVEGLVLVVTPW